MSEKQCTSQLETHGGSVVVVVDVELVVELEVELLDELEVVDEDELEELDEDELEVVVLLELVLVLVVVVLVVVVGITFNSESPQYAPALLGIAAHIRLLSVSRFNTFRSSRCKRCRSVSPLMLK